VSTENTTQRDPQVGDGATISYWSDKDAATVVQVLRFMTGQRAGQVRGVVVQRDNWTVISGNEGDGSAEYTYAPNPDADRRTFLVNKHGRFTAGGVRLFVGTRRRYQDPSF
jgi:hypothetical protein